MGDTPVELIPETLTKYKVEDSEGYPNPDMLHYPGRDEMGFGVGNNGEITRERLRQLATTRLAEQGRMGMPDANFIFQREAVAMQQKVNATVASKPLYSIGAPQRARIPKQPTRYGDQLHRNPLYDGPLNLVNRAAMQGNPYGGGHSSLDDATDLNKPLDLSMKSERLALPKVPKTIVDPRLMPLTNAEMIAKHTHTFSSNGNEVTSKVTSAQTMYRPPPMMSYGKPGRHGHAINPIQLVHRQHAAVPKDVPMSQGQLHPLASSGVVASHLQPNRSSLKRPAPVMARSASDIPMKRVVLDSMVAPSSTTPTPANIKSYQDASSRAALLAFERERGRSHAVALINQQDPDSNIRITDVRSIGQHTDTSHPAPVPKSTPSRSRTTKAAGAPVFHHIHYHHHHHHVPQPDEELLRQSSNGTPVVHARGAVPVHAGVIAQGGAAGPANGLPTHDIPSHRVAGRMVPGHEVPAHAMAAPNMASSRGDRHHGVLIKHTSTPVTTMTSPHLRRAHYQTRRRIVKSINPPTMASHASLAPHRMDPASTTSAPTRGHQHARAASPLKLVASSMAAGAQMNELLKPLDGPEQPAASAHVTNNNNNKVLLAEKLARPLRVDIPDDRAFVSHLGDLYTGQTNPVPLVRQVTNATSITKCLTSEANSSPKKSNSSGNESPTMPVLTPQSVYSPCFTTESMTNLTHNSSSVEPQPTSSPMFYSALTLSLYPRRQDATAEAVQKLPRAKDESPPNLHETSPEQLVPDHRMPNQLDTLIRRKIDQYALDAAAALDKNKREQKRHREIIQEPHDAYQLHMQELRRDRFEHRDKPKKRHTHGYSLKASMDKSKVHQLRGVSERILPSENHDDRNIFAEFMLKRQWYDGKMDARKPARETCPDQTDVIDLTTSPSSSPAPEVTNSVENKNGGSGATSKEKPEIGKNVRGLSRKREIISAFEEGRTVSVSEAIEAVFAANSPVPKREASGTETDHEESAVKQLQPNTGPPKRVTRGVFDQKDQPPKLVRVQDSPLVSATATAAMASTCVVHVITSPKPSTVLPPLTTTNGAIKIEPVFRCSSNSPSSAKLTVPFLTEAPPMDNPQLSSSSTDAAQSLVLSNTQVTSSLSALPQHLRFSPTEKTFSHDPRKKLLAAMNVQTPPASVCAVSPASVAASLSSTVSPSSGRSTPSKGSSRKRSLEITRLENTSSYVAEIPKRKQTVDLLTDPALLDREERALQRAMKRFNEMEKREKGTPTDAQTDPVVEPHTNSKKQNRLLIDKYSLSLRRGRGRGRKFAGFHRMQNHKDGAALTLNSHRQRRSFSREMRRLTSQGSRNSFQDFVPMVLEERTRHSQATRSSARERKIYHKNARYEMEIEKEERKYLERKRQKRSVSGSTSGEEESSCKTKGTPGRRRKGTEEVSRKSSDVSLAATELAQASDRESNFTSITSERTENPPEEEEGVARSPSMDTPLHVVIDPTNYTKMKFMTTSAYELHRKDSGKENKEVEAKPGGKRKFKTKHLGPATMIDSDVQKDDNVAVKAEVKESLPSASQPEPSPVKLVRPEPPAEMRRLMVNKKLGETILHRAARLAYDDVAIYCIDYDVVDINAKDNAGYTPLHECCVHGRLRVASHLLQHGADVNASASDGTRPIHDAVDNNWLALVRLLLRYGADPLIATYSGRTTIKLARTKPMKTFIIGYLSDINGEWELDEDDPYQSNLDLRWHITGTHSFYANDLAACDIFQDIPEGRKEESDGEFLFEVSDTPHLTSYNIRLPNDQRARNWLLLSDVTDQLNTTRADFLASNQTVRSVTMTRKEFTAAIEGSQLNHSPPQKSKMVLDETLGDYVVELLELTSDLRKILHIDEVYI
ncbi:uncharacterized protein LOC110981018 isoform X2 [Acanthaster planci]|uniref:Uncharacterized protein LOC110981018 isoform X2 n=1 Tax=Acanthaster planci TaxID=133434 RepID=A0A8B7YKQ5_ACAPL|nr:uncharacterized protein LOC110981018 isoform X2 [Acanthaster planci]